MAAPSSPAPADTRVTVSHVVADPIWSLRPWSVDVRVGPFYGSIPALPAADWLTHFMPDRVDLFDIVPGMCGDLEERLMPAILRGDVELDEIRRVCLDVITAVTGRPWWFATRLIKTAVASWEVVGGELALRGVDANRLSISAWLDAVLMICLRHLDAAKVTMFMSQLEAPPVEEMANVEEMEMSPDAFLALGR